MIPATTTTPVRRRPGGPVRRGVTFLEVVLGVVLMGLVASTLGAVVSAVGGSFQQQRDRLGAAEVASRITLIRIDDEEGLPDNSLPIGYGQREFRWSIDERPVLVTLSGPARQAVQQGTSSTAVDLSRRIISVTVTAWLAEESGGAYFFDPNVPHAMITRLVDPLDFSTHDSAERRLDTQQDIERFMQTFMGTTSGTAPRPQGQGGGQGGNRQRPPSGGGGGGGSGGG